MAERRRRAATEAEPEPAQCEAVGRGDASSCDAHAEHSRKRLRGSSSTSAAADKVADGGGHALHVIGNPAGNTAAPQTSLELHFAAHLTITCVVKCPFSYVIGRWPEWTCDAI